MDGFTHLYTLILKPDHMYKVKIDNEIVAEGILEDDWDFLPPRRINDPTIKKPDDWDDNAEIEDPEDTKPEVIVLLVDRAQEGLLLSGTLLALHGEGLGFSWSQVGLGQNFFRSS